MSVYDRINQIEQRLQSLEARFESNRGLTTGSAPPRVVSGSSQSADGVSFERLVNSMTEDQKFRPTHGLSGAGASRPDPAQFDGMIREASQKWNVDESLIRAVIKQESAFDPQATSWCGAQGLMQLMPETAAGLGVKDSYDPQQNIMGGTRYLRSLLDRFDGNISKALAGYNAGPGAVEKHGGIPPYQETQHYVSNVLEFYRGFKENRGAI